MNLELDKNLVSLTPLNYLKLDDINIKLKKLVSSERKITQHILELINIVDQRKLYLKMNYNSLYDYLTKYLGYNESSAYRRMQAARLLNQCPEIKTSISDGKLKLSQMAQMQTAITAQNKLQPESKITREQKLSILTKLENKTQAETKVVLIQELPAFDQINSMQPQKPLVHHHDESVSVNLKLTKSQFAILQQVKNLMSHINNGKTEDILINLCQKEISRRTGLSKNNSENVIDKLKTSKTIEENKTLCKNMTTEETSLSSLAFNKKEINFKPSLKISNRKYVPINLKRAVYQKYQNSCRICHSQFQLQIDHIKPIWAGGLNTLDNLQLLCGAHNRQKYLDQSYTKNVIKYNMI